MLKPKEAAAMLGVSTGTIYSLAKTGAIAHYRIGSRISFEEAQVQAYMESCKVAIRVPKVMAAPHVNVSLTGSSTALQEYFEKHRLEKEKNKLEKARLKLMNKPKT